jgi:hypothetical protein
MKSLDPWATIVTDEFGDVICPRASYGHPFYREVPSWIHYGGDDDTQRLLFDGAFIGAEVPFAGAADPIQMLEVTAMSRPDVYAGHPMGAEVPPLSVPGGTEPRRGLLAEVAPHVAPATGPISVKKTFDDHQVLHVEICVDDKCYRTSMDLAPAIEMVMTKLAQWHKAQHAPTPSTAIVGAIEGAIDAAGNAMADTLICHHGTVMMGGFFDDVGSALGGTLRQLAPVISTVATSVATYYGGSAAGAAAGQLAPVVTNLQANLLDPKGSPKTRAAAQQTLQYVNQVAQGDPHAAQALAAAHQAVRDTAVAYHVKGAVDKAVAGDPVAQQNVAAVVQAAEKGDPVAKSTYEVIVQTLLNNAQHSEWGARLWEKIMGGGGDTTVGFWPYYLLAGGLGTTAGILLERYTNEADLAARVNRAFSYRDQAWREAFRQRDQAWGADYERVLRALGQVSPSAFEDYVRAANAARHEDQGVQSQGQTTTSAGWYSAPVVVGSFWDDVGNAVLTVTGTKATNQFIQDHGLAPYVKLAAQGVATFYGGPAAGAAAGALAPSVMSLGVADKGKAAAAQQDVQGVTAMAQQHSPQMAQAVNIAKGSIKGAATAYHIDHLLRLAKRGDARSQRALTRLQALAAAGDPNAQKALQAVDAIHRGQLHGQMQPSEQVQPPEQMQPPVSGWYDIIGAVINAGGAPRRYPGRGQHSN